MKNTILISGFAMILMSCQNESVVVEETTAIEETQQDESAVPEAVQSAFNSAYPEAKDVEWEMENDIYEVEFELGENEHEAAYNAAGNKLEFETKLTEESQIPENALRYISENYPNAEIEEAAKKEITGKGAIFEVVIEVESEGEEADKNEDGMENDEGEIIVELIFDADGNFVELEKDEEEVENEEEGEED